MSTEDIKEKFKEIIQWPNHETYLCKRKVKVDLLSKSILSLSVEDEESCMTPLRQILFFVLVCLKMNFKRL